MQRLHICKSWGNEIIIVCIGQPPPHHFMSCFMVSAEALSVNFIKPERESRLIVQSKWDMSMWQKFIMLSVLALWAHAQNIGYLQGKSHLRSLQVMHDQACYPFIPCAEYTPGFPSFIFIGWWWCYCRITWLRVKAPPHFRWVSQSEASSPGHTPTHASLV